MVGPWITATASVLLALWLTVWLQRELRRRAARTAARAFVGALSAFVCVGSVLWWIGEVPGLIPSVSIGVLVITLFGVDSIVRATGGPRALESLMVAISSMTDWLQAEVESAESADDERVQRWRTELERWRQEDTAAYVDAHQAILDRWQAYSGEQVADRLRAIRPMWDALEPMWAAMTARSVSAGADMGYVARLRGYAGATPDATDS